MKTADLITSYLNNEMSPDQERQFLLSVAASDSLRLSLKSHVMLDKIVTNQIQHAHVPESVRDTIFMQMSGSLSGSQSIGTAASSGMDATDGAGVSFMARLFNGSGWRFGRGALLVFLTLGGYAAGYFTHPDAPVVQQAAVSAPVRNIPETTQPQPAPVGSTTPGTAETKTASSPVTPVTQMPSATMAASASDARPATSPVTSSATRHEAATAPRQAVARKQAAATTAAQPATETHAATSGAPAVTKENGHGPDDTILRTGSSPVSVTPTFTRSPRKVADPSAQQGAPKD